MKFPGFKSLTLQFIVLNQFCFGYFSNPGYSLELESINKVSSDYIRNIPDSSFYLLGPGDTLDLKVTEATSELNKKFTINGEGIANLERLNRIYVSGLTIAELTEILNKEYSVYVKDPDVNLSIVNYRPIKIYIKGEVEVPGIHILKGESSLLESLPDRTDSINNISLKNSINYPRNNNSFPSVFDAIRESGGVTMFADLSDIKVTRINTISKGSGRIGTNINLLDTIELKDNSQNIRLYDGDTIFVPKSEEVLMSQIAGAIKSNLNPKYIDVVLSGRVENPGIIKVSKISALTEAINVAGGAKVLKGPVHFLRYNSDGGLDRRKFGLKMSASRGSYRNPYLKNGDIIYVGKSILNTTNEVVTEVTAPLQGLFSAIGFYQLLLDN